MTSRTYTTGSGLDDPRVDRNARKQTAGLDLGDGFYRDDQGRLQLRTREPLKQDKDGAYTVAGGDGAAEASTTQSFVTVGPDFPPDPDPGAMHVHSGLEYEPFVWDQTRGKWLSIAKAQVAFTSQATVAVAAQFRLFQGPVCSTTQGFPLPFAATLVEIRATKNNTGAAPTVDVQSGATVKKSHTFTSTAEVSYETGINVDFDAGAIVNCTPSAVGVVNGGTVTCIFRRRAS